jgi:hypothetical protein
MSADSRPNKDWMFCPLTGSLLRLDAHKGIAYSDLSNYTVDLEGGWISHDLMAKCMRVAAAAP